MIDVFAIVEDLGRRRGQDAGRISVIELNRSGPAQRAVALLAFLDGAPEPIAFIKATSDAGRAGALEQEFANLTRLSRGGDPFRRSIPEPLYCEKIGELTVLAESAKPGTRMKDLPPDRYFGSPEFRTHFSTAIRWLATFSSVASEEVAPSPADGAAREVTLFRATHRVSPALDALLDDSLRALEDREIPLTPSHGDFCTANVIPGDGGIFVIDWEYPLAPTWPLSDLLYFITSTWCTPYAKGREALQSNFRSLFFTPHPFADLIRHETTWYASQLSIPADLLLPLSTLCWTAYANRKHAELEQARTGGAPANESGHLPLVMISDSACLNLELLAAHRSDYLL